MMELVVTFARANRSGQRQTFQCKSMLSSSGLFSSAACLGLTSGESLRQGKYHQEGRVRSSKEDVKGHGVACSKKQEKGEMGIQEVVIISLMSRNSFQDGLFF